MITLNSWLRLGCGCKTQEAAEGGLWWICSTACGDHRSLWIDWHPGDVQEFQRGGQIGPFRVPA